jgi:hypothetical protein
VSTRAVPSSENDVLKGFLVMIRLLDEVCQLTVPELTATQSSWLYTVAPSVLHQQIVVSKREFEDVLMVIPVDEPMSKASVFLPRESPADPSTVM